jgi:hypothetical protein
LIDDAVVVVAVAVVAVDDDVLVRVAVEDGTKRRETTGEAVPQT